MRDGGDGDDDEDEDIVFTATVECVLFVFLFWCFGELGSENSSFPPPSEKEKEYNTILSMTGRRKNKNPKRAENVKTVVVVTKTSGGAREEDDDKDVERLRRMLMCNKSMGPSSLPSSASSLSLFLLFHRCLSPYSYKSIFTLQHAFNFYCVIILSPLLLSRKDL